jgi:hypothetical protein
MDVGAEKLSRTQPGRIFLEQWRAGEANEQGIRQPALHLPIHVTALAAVAFIHEYVETATHLWRRSLEIVGIELLQQGAKYSGSAGTEFGHKLVSPSDTGRR